VFPIRDDNPHFLTPLVTYGLIGLNTAAWVLVQGLGADPALATSVCELGLTPGELLGNLPPGTSVPLTPSLACVVEAAPAYHTVFTSMFMHGGWFHILSNMWFLWIFGNNVEDSMGHVRFAVFYLLCGLVAAGLQVASNPGSAVPMVGASGAIGGVMGAYVLLYPRVNVHLFLWFGFFFTTVAVPAYFMLGYWLLIQLVGGLGSLGSEGGGVAFWAHVGGFAAGAALIPLFKSPKLLRRHPYHGWRGGSAGHGWSRVR
jgi:membrane associated rhomboid family serine protease